MQWKDQWYNDRYKPFIGRVSEPEWFKNIVFVYMFPEMLSGVDFGIISEIDKLLEEINTQLHQFLALALDKLGESLSDSDKVVELCMDASFDELIMALWTAKRGLNQSFHRYDEIMALCKEDLQGVFDLPIPSGVLNQQDLLRSLCLIIGGGTYKSLRFSYKAFFAAMDYIAEGIDSGSQVKKGLLFLFAKVFAPRDMESYRCFAPILSDPKKLAKLLSL